MKYLKAGNVIVFRDYNCILKYQIKPIIQFIYQRDPQSKDPAIFVIKKAVLEYVLRHEKEDLEESRTQKFLIASEPIRQFSNEKNLMSELHKIHTIIEKEYPEALLETFIVVDGTTGQNALAQAKEFSEVADVTGVVLTKLDGTAKGGIAIAIQSELSIPVKYIGIGEQIGDLQRFDAEEFVNALFETE